MKHQGTYSETVQQTVTRDTAKTQKIMGSFVSNFKQQASVTSGPLYVPASTPGGRSPGRLPPRFVLLQHWSRGTSPKPTNAVLVKKHNFRQLWIRVQIKAYTYIQYTTALLLFCQYFSAKSTCRNSILRTAPKGMAHGMLFFDLHHCVAFAPVTYQQRHTMPRLCHQ